MNLKLDERFSGPERVKMGPIILAMIAMAGFMAVALVAPNAVQIVKMFEKGKKRRTAPEHRVKTAFNRLIADGSIKKVQRSGRTGLELTQRGREKLGKLYRYHALVEKPKRWDGRWRIVSFDVYEKRRKFRDRLRGILKAVGFLQIHKSMWVYPYDCEELITLLKSDLKMGRNVLYIVAARIEADGILRKHFGLR